MHPSTTPSNPPVATPAVASPEARRRAVLASTVGSAVEFYEFTVYGFLAVVFGPLFFPAADPTAATLSALAVFGAGYLARPLGGIFFGALGDRIGRRSVLMATIFLMGGASMLIGVLPTYAQIGVLAPLLLVVLRLVQGFAAGGEVAGAQTYIVEMAPPGRRALFGSLPALGVGLGFASASLTVAATIAAVGPDMQTYGWRIPFLVCFPLTVLCLFLRRRLEDSPEFAAIAAGDTITRTPVRDVLRSNLPDVLRVAGLTIAILGPGFLGKLYFAIYLVQVRQVPPVVVYSVLGVLLLLAAVLGPVMGRVSDRVGRRPIARIGFLAFLVLSLPLYLLAAHTTDLWILVPALLLFLLVEPFCSAAVFTSLTEFFPGRVRYTGTAIGFNLGTIVAAGFGPYVAGKLIVLTGWTASPGLWGVACAALGLLVLTGTRETRDGALLR